MTKETERVPISGPMARNTSVNGRMTMLLVRERCIIRMGVVLSEPFQGQPLGGRSIMQMGVSEATLERWRSEGIGPRYLKLQGRVMYREKDIEAYEANCLRQSTSISIADG